MGKAVKKVNFPDIDMEQPASSSKNKRKTPCQSKSKGSKKVPKTTTKGKTTIQGSASKKVSEKTSTSVKKTKKAKGTILFGHYHRLNEKLNKSEAKEEKNAENSTNSSDGQGN